MNPTSVPLPPPQLSFTPWNPGDLLYVLLPFTQQLRAGRGAGGLGHQSPDHCLHNLKDEPHQGLLVSCLLRRH